MTTSTASDQVSLLSQTGGDDLSSARRVLGIEANALNSLAESFGNPFKGEFALRIIFGTSGRT